MSLSIESERTKRWPNLEKRWWCSPNGTLLGNWIISGALDLGFRSILYGWKGKT